MIQAILSYLIFLPNVVPPFGFLTSDNLQAFPVETFPWAFLFCLSPKLVMDRAYLILMALFALSMGMTIAAYGQITNSMRSLFAILNASLIFYRLMGSDRTEFHGLIKAMAVIFALNYLTSLLQFLGLFPRFIGDFYQIFVPRFSPEIHDIGGRGVYGLFPEPAYSASFMHFTFAFMVLWWKLNPFERKGAVAFIVMFIFDVVLNRSATALGMLVLFFLSFVQFKHLWKVGVLAVVVLVGSAFLSRNLADPPRVLQIINNLFFTPETDDLFLTLLNESGFRLIGIWAGYLYGILHPLGGGIGSWPVSSVAALEATGIESFEIYYFLEFNDGFYLGIRPSAFAAGLFLEAGIIGCLAFSFIFLRHFKGFSYSTNAYWRGVLNLFLFYYFLLGVIGDPTPFIMMGLSWLALSKFPPNELPSNQMETANLEDENASASS